MQYRSTLLSALLVSLVGSASAQVVTYGSALTGGAEFPANGSSGTGWATVIVDFDNVTMRVKANFMGLSGPTSASHIHVRPLGQDNGGVATQTPSFPGFPLGVTSGSFDATYDMTLASSYRAAFLSASGGTTAAAFSALTTAMADGLSYFNVHTTAFPGGELRGDLAPVPEPATMAVLRLGLAAIARKRRK